jgi:hypothetical protein
MHRALLLLGFAVVVCALASGGRGGGGGSDGSDVSTSASGPSPGSYVVFWSDRAGGAGREDIYFYHRSKSSLVSLPGINSADADWYPTISADGRYIAFSSSRCGAVAADDIYLETGLLSPGSPLRLEDGCVPVPQAPGLQWE